MLHLARFGMQTQPNIVSARHSRLSTKRELADETGLGTRLIDSLVKKRAIPFLRLGHKTLRFDPAKVRAALDRFTVKEVR